MRTRSPRRQTLVAFVAFVAFVVAMASAQLGCRIGGASENPQPPLDAVWLPDGAVAGGETSPDTGNTNADTTIDDTGAPVDTSSADDSSGSDTGSATDSASSDAHDAGEVSDARDATDSSDAPAVCTPGTAAECDPVANTGCPGGSRCTTSSTTLTGRCVYLGAIGVGGFCTATDGALGFLGTDTCSSKLACLSSKCVALCWCNGDCESGSCCNVDFGSSGFKGCGACH